MMKRLVWSLAVGLIFCSTALCDSLINGDFETGTLAGWTTNSFEYMDGGGSSSATASLGAGYGSSYGAWLNVDVTLGDPGFDEGYGEVTLSQSFSAQAGQSLNFDYYFGSQYSDADSYASAWIEFNGTNIWSSALPGIWNGSGLEWGSITSTVFEATGTYTVSFYTYAYAMEQGSNSAQLGVDNVQIVPEPATAGLLIVPGLFIALYRRFFGRV